MLVGGKSGLSEALWKIIGTRCLRCAAVVPPCVLDNSWTTPGQLWKPLFGSRRKDYWEVEISYRVCVFAFKELSRSCPGVAQKC